MDHLAIMNPRWHLIDKIVSWEKTIESRRYQTRRAPWDRVWVGDSIYFKDSGALVTVKATVSHVLQFSHLDLATISRIVDEYGEGIGLVTTDLIDWWLTKKYCILMFLEHPLALDEPFKVDKTGFWSGVARLSLDTIESIKTS